MRAVDGVAAPGLQIKRLEDELLARHDAVTCAFIELLDLRDIDTGVHSTRLAEWAVRVGERLGLSDAILADLETASLLHDLGKIGISDAILRKPGPLTDSEMAQLRKHSEYGWAILKRISGFETAALYILHHHERIDGRGYPAGLTGDQIPIAARIVGIVDAFDAMVSNRCYRRAVSVEEALRRLREASGTQFDGDIVNEFAAIVEMEVDEIHALVTAAPAEAEAAATAL
jgi:HD-GYP domain-containing protein (c-di-GMP phosphodiesterase class II)